MKTGGDRCSFLNKIFLFKNDAEMLLQGFSTPPLLA